LAQQTPSKRARRKVAAVVKADSKRGSTGSSGLAIVDIQDGTVTVKENFFGFKLIVSTYNSAGNLTNVTLMGFDVTFLFWMSL
jgi:hypothetical protein